MNRRKWLVDLRKKLGYTQEQAAEEAGVERSTYAKAETGNSISVATAKAIAKAFDFNWVLFFDDKCDEKGQKEQKEQLA
jgi:transcriptional regulator with XRE-family HTH domain